ncbi:MAG: hypothetical protein AAF999_11095 [Pseudomonadota bacterium]
MHPFVLKVILAAVVLTLASVAGASQSRADTAFSLEGRWYNDYDKQAERQTSTPRAAGIIIEKRAASQNKRVALRNPAKPRLRQYKADRHHAHTPQRRRVHASGYRW